MTTETQPRSTDTGTGDYVKTHFLVGLEAFKYAVGSWPVTALCGKVSFQGRQPSPDDPRCEMCKLLERAL